mgnify:CR=1 FL=1
MNPTTAIPPITNIGVKALPSSESDGPRLPSASDVAGLAEKSIGGNPILARCTFRAACVLAA